jgi:hypothetical protein
MDFQRGQGRARRKARWTRGPSTTMGDALVFFTYPWFSWHSFWLFRGLFGNESNELKKSTDKGIATTNSSIIERQRNRNIFL